MFNLLTFNFSTYKTWSHDLGERTPLYLLKCKEKSASHYNEHHSKIKHAVIPRHNNPSIAVKLVSAWKNFPIPIWHDGCVLLYSHGGFLSFTASKLKCRFPSAWNQSSPALVPVCRSTWTNLTGKIPPETTAIANVHCSERNVFEHKAPHRRIH